MKQIVSIFLLCTLLLGAGSVYKVKAEETAEPPIVTSADGNYKYRMAKKDIDYDVEYEDDIDYEPYSKSSIEIIKYIGDELSGKYTIPEKIDGYSVWEIGERAFKDCGFTELTAYCGKIDRAAFYGCKNLKKVKIPYSSDVGEIAFKNCTRLEEVTMYTGKYGDDLFIWEEAFYNCPNLKKVTLHQRYYFSGEKIFGYYYDKKSKTEKKVKNLTFNCVSGGENLTWDTVNYANRNGFKANISCAPDQLKAIDFWRSGYEFRMLIDGKVFSGWGSTDSKVVSITKKGKLRLLKSGEASIYVKLQSGEYYSRVVIVHGDNPNIKATYKKTLTVKKGKTGKILIYGKVASIDNKITNLNPKTVKVVSGKASDYIKVKGLKKGTAKLKVKVNGVKTITLTVNVT